MQSQLREIGHVNADQNVGYAAALSFTRGAQITSITCERPNCNQAVELSGRIIEYCIPYSSEVLTFTLL